MSQTTLSATSQRARQRQQTRDRIFRAAVAEFREVGFQQAQIPRIAEAAGVVRGTFYFHFSSKDDVLYELATRLQSEILDALQTLSGTAACFAEVLSGLAEAVARISDALAGADLIRDVMATFLRADFEADGPGAAFRDELTRQIERALARGELRPHLDPDQLASTVLACIFGIMILPRGPEPRHRPELSLLAALLADGMRQPEASAL